MHVSRVLAKRVLPFKDIDVTISGTGVTLVLGNFQAFSGVSSNGSGKSAFIDCITLAWFDRAMNGDKLSACIQNGEKSAYAGSEITDGKTIWRVDRYYKDKKHGTTTLFTIDGKDHTQGTPTLTQAHIEKVIGDFERFTATNAYAAQADAGTFYLMSDGEKKKFLERMFELGWCAGAKENAKIKLRKAESKCNELRIDIENYTDVIRDAKIRKAETELEIVNERYAERIKDAKRALAELHALTDSITAKLEKAKRVRDRSKGDDALKGYEYQIAKRATTIAELRSSLSESKAYVERGERERQRITDRIEEIKSNPGICSYCGGPLPKKKAKAELANLEKELEEYGTKLDATAMEVISNRRALKALLREPEIEKPELTIDPDEARRHYKAVKQLDESHHREIQSAEEAISLLRSLRKRQTEALEQAIGDIRTAKTARRSSSDELGVYTAKKEQAQFWVEGFGDKGIKAFVLEHYLPAISAQASLYASRLFGAEIGIAISATTKLKTKDETSEKIGIEVSIPGCSRTYRRASKAQKRRLDLAILLAIGKVVEAVRPSAISHVFVDELFDGMDDVGIEVAGDLLAELGRGRPVMVVSHEDRLKATADHVIRITHNGTYATAK